MPKYHLLYKPRTEKDAAYSLGEIDMPFVLRTGDTAVVSYKIMAEIRKVEPCIALTNKFIVKEVTYKLTQQDEHTLPIDIIIERYPQKVSPWPNTSRQWFRFFVGAVGIVIIYCFAFGIIGLNSLITLGSLMTLFGYIMGGLLENIEERKKQRY